MGLKRSPGDGHIRRTASNKFRGELMLGYKPDGARNVFRCTGDTKEEVRREFRRALHKYELGEPATPSKQTVEQFLLHWLATVAKPAVFARTYSGYEELIRLHALPGLGRHKLDKLTPAHLASLYTQKLETLSAQRVLHLHRVLHRAFETALRWGLLAVNPCSRVDPPRVPKRQQTALNPEQAVSFYHAVHGEPMEAFWVLALTTGMRSGELYALQWGDIDWQARTIRVQRALSRVSGVGRIEKSTKTDAGRPVPLIDIALASLRRHEAKQVRGIKLIFTSITGRPLQEDAMRQDFLRLLTKAGLPRMRPYDLRHSAASLMLALGVGPRDVQAILGHASVTLTMDLYGHSFPSVQHDSLAKLNELLGK